MTQRPQPRKSMARMAGELALGWLVIQSVLGFALFIALPEALDELKGPAGTVFGAGLTGLSMYLAWLLVRYWPR